MLNSFELNRIDFYLSHGHVTHAYKLFVLQSVIRLALLDTL